MIADGELIILDFINYIYIYKIPPDFYIHMKKVKLFNRDHIFKFLNKYRLIKLNLFFFCLTLSFKSHSICYDPSKLSDYISFVENEEHLMKSRCIFTRMVVRRKSERWTRERNGEREAGLSLWCIQKEKSPVIFHTPSKCRVCMRVHACEKHRHVHACFSPTKNANPTVSSSSSFFTPSFFSLFFQKLSLLIAFQRSEDEFSSPPHSSLEHHTYPLMSPT